MAGASAAPANNASTKVDTGLWWDSHADFIEKLDELESLGGQDLVASEALWEDKLRAQHEWLLNSLSLFKSPSATSKAALDSSKLDFGVRKLDVTDKLKAVAQQGSKHLDLDEVQAYILASRLDPSVIDAGLAMASERQLIQSLQLQYYFERQCLLKSLKVLLVLTESEQVGGAGPQKAIEQEVASLQEQGLMGRVLALLEQQLAADPPKLLKREEVNLWAEEVALEVLLLLDILFLLFYQRGCPSATFKSLFNLLQKHVLCQGPGSHGGLLRLAVTAVAQRSVQQAVHLSVLLLVEALNLDHLLVALEQQQTLAESGHSFSPPHLQEIGALMEQLEPSRWVEQGPVVLAWALFSCLASALPQSQPSQVLDQGRRVQEAYNAGAYELILDILRGPLVENNEVQASGYKTVVKTLMASCLAAYDFAGQMGTNGFETLIDILCEIYSGQEGLCADLWDIGGKLEWPIRSLLASLLDRLPQSSACLARLLANTCHGTWAAQCTFNFLYRGMRLCTRYELPGGSPAGSHPLGAYVRASSTLQVPGVPGLLIPEGTAGKVLAYASSSVAVLQWECKHSAILVLLLGALQHSSDTAWQKEELSKVQAVLDLLASLVAASKDVTELLLNIADSSLSSDACKSGYMEPHVRVELVPMLCSIAQAVSQGPCTAGTALLAPCLRILAAFSACYPEDVCSALACTCLMQPSSLLPLTGGLGILEDNLLSVTLMQGEQATGSYPFTLAVLDILVALLSKGLSGGWISTLLRYVLYQVMPLHTTWRYSKRHQFWQISSKALQVLRVAAMGSAWGVVMDDSAAADGSGIGDGPPAALVETELLLDSGALTALFQILTTDSKALEEVRLLATAPAAESEWQQQAVVEALHFLRLLLLRALAASAKDVQLQTLMELTLFHGAAGQKLPQVTAIASLATYRRNSAVQEAALRALALLCTSAQNTRPFPVALTVFLPTSTLGAELRTEVGSLLSTRSATLFPSVFKAAVELLHAAVGTQPSLVELLLYPGPGPATESSPKRTSLPVAGSASSVLANRVSEPSSEPQASPGLESLSALLKEADAFLRRDLKAILLVLRLLVELWEEGSSHLPVLLHLRKQPSFWLSLQACLFHLPQDAMPLLLTSSSPAAPNEGHSWDQLQGKAADGDSGGMTGAALSVKSCQCETAVLRLIAHDIFLGRHLASDMVTSVDAGSPGEPRAPGASTGPVSGAMRLIQDWPKLSGQSVAEAVKKFARCRSDPNIMHQAKAEAGMLAVGLMVRVVQGDTRGLHAELADRVRSAVLQLLRHPSMVELAQHYSSRSYSHGKQNQLEGLMLEDLYEHLQGQLRGNRPIPPGPFQQVVAYLEESSIDSLLQPQQLAASGEQQTAETVGPPYNTDMLAAAMGLPWWTQTDRDVLSRSAAESSLRCLREANDAAALANAQLAALDWWTGLITVAALDERGQVQSGAGSVADAWGSAALEEAMVGNCADLEVTVKAALLGTGSMFPGILRRFIDKQSQLLSLLLRLWASPRASSRHSAGGAMFLGAAAKAIRGLLACLKGLQAGRPFLDPKAENGVKPMLAALLLLLDIVQAANSASSGPGSGEGFAEAALGMQGFLPCLCRTAVEEPYRDLVAALLTMTIRSFLEAPSFMPLLSSHLALPHVLGRLKGSATRESREVLLALLVALAGVTGGPTLLHQAGLLGHLARFSDELWQGSDKDAAGQCRAFVLSLKGPEGQPQTHSQWASGLLLAAMALRHVAGGEQLHYNVDQAIQFVASQKERILALLQVPPATWHHHVQANLGGSGAGQPLETPKAYTSLATLISLHNTLLLLLEAAKWAPRWTSILPGGTNDFCESLGSFLAFVAREGLRFPAGAAVTSQRRRMVMCSPATGEEKTWHAKPSRLKCHIGWFAVAAAGENESGAQDLVGPTPETSPLSPAAASPVGKPAESLAVALFQTPQRGPVKGAGSGPVVAAVGSSMFTDQVAIRLYGCVHLALQFVCCLASSALQRAQDSVALELPVLPSPDVLHGLQDQALAILTDIYSRSPGPSENDDTSFDEVTALMALVLEQALLLEAFLVRFYGLELSPLRHAQLSKSRRGLGAVVKGRPQMESTMRVLANITDQFHVP